MRSFILASSLLLTLAALPACGDDAEPASAVAGDNNGTNNGTNNGANNGTINGATNNGDVLNNGDPETGPHALFNFAALASREGFYDYPFPSDARLTPDGAPDVSRFYAPDNLPLLPDVVLAIHRDVRGFSPNSGAWFRFSEPLDPDSLPATPDDARAEDATAWIVDIDPDSPFRGRRYPLIAHYRATAGRSWLPDTLALQPVLGYPLRPGTLHAAVVSRRVTTLSGASLVAPQAFLDLLGDTPPPGREVEWTALRPAVEFIGADAMRSDVAVATAFRTADPAAEMQHLRTWIYENLRPAETKNWTVYRDRTNDGYIAYEASFAASDFFSGQYPYLEVGEGIIELDADGAPRNVNRVLFRLTLTVPTGQPPEKGWPLAIYAHGTGGDSRGFLTPSGRDAASEGVAMICIDQPVHGARNPGNGSEVDYLLQIALENTVAGRDLFRHAIPDLVQLVRLIKQDDFVVPPSVSRTGQPIRFDTTHLAFVGHSQGSQAGAMFIGVEPEIESAFLSEGGGGASAAFLLRKANGVDIEQLVALSLGIDLATEPMRAFHPVVGVLIQPMLDSADPLNYATAAIREPLNDRPKHIVMTEGLEDDLTIPLTIEALAAAYGLPIVEPVHQTSAVHDLYDLGPVALPAENNVDLGPVPVTGGLLQFPGQGHYPLFNVRTARFWYKRWIRSAADGQPVIAAP